MGFKRSIATAVVLALVLAGLTAFLVANHFGALAKAKELVNHTHEVIDQTRLVFSLVEEAESSQRGYLLTQDPAFLTPYRRAVVAVPQATQQLIDIVSDNPDQQIRARELAAAASDRMRIIARALTYAEAGDFAGARDFVISGGGLQVMSRLRDRANGMIANERRLLVERTREADRRERLTLLTALGIGALALLALVGGLVLMARANRDLQVSMAETDASRRSQAATEALTQAIFANVPDHLLVLDLDPDGAFTVAEMNPAFALALNVQIDRVRGRRLVDLLRGRASEVLTNHYRRVLSSDRPVLTRDVIPFPTGARTWESILAPVRDSAGHGRRIIGSIRDITERVQAEERLRGSQRMEAVGQLTGGVAHDFNNLLQVIRGNLELLERRLPQDDAQIADRLHNALHGVERAGQLTRQLLAFARRQPLEPRPISLSRLVGDMTDMLRRTIGETVEVETVVAGGLWNTIADPAQVESAVLNLAINARDAMPEGGRLTVELTNAVLDEAYTRGLEDVEAGQYVLLAVSDTGEGMSPEIRAKVFEPFFSTKAEGRGTGLGLSMVYGFVKQTGGHIQIYSEPGQGTTVKIYLPRTRQPLAQVTQVTAVPASGAGELILVVEDDEMVRAGALAMLEDLGYRCLEAFDFETALDTLRDNPDIALIFSDVVMPGAINTREFSTRIKALRPDLPVLFTSGYTENAIVHHGRLDEGVNLLSKPYTRADLLRKTQQLLTEAQGQVG